MKTVVYPEVKQWWAKHYSSLCSHPTLHGISHVGDGHTNNRAGKRFRRYDNLGEKYHGFTVARIVITALKKGIFCLGKKQRF